MAETPPRTLAGLIAKARVARLIGGDDTICQQFAWDIGIVAGECEPDETAED